MTYAVILSFIMNIFYIKSERETRCFAQTVGFLPELHIAKYTKRVPQSGFLMLCLKSEFTDGFLELSPWFFRYTAHMKSPMFRMSRINDVKDPGRRECHVISDHSECATMGPE